MWTENDKQLSISVSFTDFSSAWAFMTEVALVAEKAGHHPDWHNVYNRVTIRLSTHEAGNTVTQKDRDLAS
ncbi:MAG TPA: 4a-hydroxytetrahydrobiopterin dehydratase, partial [Saprospiraceae bacterium]|nr:4a-hydroxytetrahydrobiopterin dehydratase [Saprospiraceae bacterium]